MFTALDSAALFTLCLRLLVVQFPRIPNQNFNITKNVFNAANIPFQPKTTYVQQTLDFSSVLPLYNEVRTPSSPHHSYFCLLWHLLFAKPWSHQMYLQLQQRDNHSHSLQNLILAKA